MDWDPGSIHWPQQMFMLLITLPPIFIIGVLLAFAGPLFGKRG